MSQRLTLLERLVLAAAALLEEKMGVPGQRGVHLYDLTKVLAELDKRYRARTGRGIGLTFIDYSFGPYSPELEPLLEKLAEKGFAEYYVEVRVPSAPKDTDKEYAWIIVEHQWSERDADKKYVKKLFLAKHRPRLPPDIAKLLENVVKEYIEGF